MIDGRTEIGIWFWYSERWARLFEQFLGLNKLYPVVVMTAFLLTNQVEESTDKDRQTQLTKEIE